MRHLMNRIQSKSYRMRTYKINKSLLSYVGDKIYIQNNGCDRFAPDYYS